MNGRRTTSTPCCSRYGKYCSTRSRLEGASVGYGTTNSAFTDCLCLTSDSCHNLRAVRDIRDPARAHDHTGLPAPGSPIEYPDEAQARHRERRDQHHRAVAVDGADVALDQAEYERQP